MHDLTWKDLFPFESRFYTTQEGHKIHYVEAGVGIPVVLVGGLLGWIFQYRNLMQYLVETQHRVIAVDHLGFGLSEKPLDYDYAYKSHLRNLTHFLTNEIRIPRFHLVVQGLGAPFALGYAVRHPERLRKIVLLNAPCFPDVPHLPGDWLKHLPVLREILFQKTGLYVRQHLRHSVVEPLPPAVRDGFLEPLSTPEKRMPWFKNWMAYHRGKKNPAFRQVSDLSLRLSMLDDKEVLCLGGEKDRIFFPDSFDEWKHHLPHSLVISVPNVGHYLLEDRPDQLIPMIGRFLD